HRLRPQQPLQPARQAQDLLRQPLLRRPGAAPGPPVHRPGGRHLELRRRPLRPRLRQSPLRRPVHAPAARQDQARPDRVPPKPDRRLPPPHLPHARHRPAPARHPAGGHGTSVDEQGVRRPARELPAPPRAAPAASRHGDRPPHDRLRLRAARRHRREPDQSARVGGVPGRRQGVVRRASAAHRGRLRARLDRDGCRCGRGRDVVLAGGPARDRQQQRRLAQKKRLRLLQAAQLDQQGRAVRLLRRRHPPRIRPPERLQPPRL
ncbi:hypothetical protein KEM52_004334, partial [Ascosphaera acerosa]